VPWLGREDFFTCRKGGRWAVPWLGREDFKINLVDGGQGVVVERGQLDAACHITHTYSPRLFSHVDRLLNAYDLGYYHICIGDHTHMISANRWVADVTGCRLQAAG
jgi:hypothetical protein